jgi:hypothetical protein
MTKVAAADADAVKQRDEAVQQYRRHGLQGRWDDD